MKTDYCAYPPQIAADIEITKQPDGERVAFIVGSVAVGRYLLLRATEYQVLGLIDGARSTAGVCDEFKELTGSTLSLQTLVKFLSKLDGYGILAGERASGVATPESQLSQMHYIRFNLFNPDPLFARLAPKLRWIWTKGFFVFSTGLMVMALLLALINSVEVTNYGAQTLGEHFITVFVAAWLVGVTHEFAHGMTCKVFGGRATEVGVLMIYYFFPALYCNVSAIHLIPQRNRRLWVIAAGVYWQLIVGSVALLVWFCLAPHSLIADLAFIIHLGSVLDVFFNANPLIKLDGYYFLSQLLRLPNLMDRSRAYWCNRLRYILTGESSSNSYQYSRRERTIYLVFGLLSFLYNIAFASLIVIFIGEWLTEKLNLAGLVLTLSIGLIFMRRAIKTFAIMPLVAMIEKAKIKLKMALSSEEGKMADNNQTDVRKDDKRAWPWFRRRRLVPASIVLLAIAALLMPWTASVGNYGTLIVLPNREGIIRAPENATLIALRVQPGEHLSRGEVIGGMGNLDQDEQIVEVQSDLARANADYDRLLGEIRTREESAVHAELKLRQRRYEFDEIEAERRQIAEASRFGNDAGTFRIIQTSHASSFEQEPGSGRYPAALSVLQSEVDRLRAQMNEANTQLGRARRLFEDGITARSELDAVDTHARTLAMELAGARDRLEAALIQHRRKHANTMTEMGLARSDVGAEMLQVEKLNREMHAMREVISTLENRRDLVQRKHAQFELVAPTTGMVYGEDLQRMVGKYFQKGAEICRIADTRQMLFRVNVPEREIGDIRVGHAVRLKTRAFPDRIFHGIVSKIGGESEMDQYNQAVYRVELTIDNEEGMLRPGMTAFARIDFDRQMIGRIIVHKIKQALRPELWMF